MVSGLWSVEYGVCNVERGANYRLVRRANGLSQRAAIRWANANQLCVNDMNLASLWLHVPPCPFINTQDEDDDNNWGWVPLDISVIDSLARSTTFMNAALHLTIPVEV